MTTLDLRQAGPSGDTRPADLDVVLPVYNEAHVLEAHVTVLRHFLDTNVPVRAVITIADNASTDSTYRLAAGLAESMPGVRALHLDRKGRGLALRTAWTASASPVVAYMDIDLSTGLDALLSLAAPLLAGRADVAIGSRLAPGAQISRSLKREVISRSYNAILRASLGARFSDAQCGFKAVRSEVARRLLPLVADNNWFFDTELLIQAQRHGFRIQEVPVSWVEDPDSRVDLLATAAEDLKGVWRLRRTASRSAVPVR
jgi:glycosyltransferase involved in cell wall biosynthesis